MAQPPFQQPPRQPMPGQPYLGQPPYGPAGRPPGATPPKARTGTAMKVLTIAGGVLLVLGVALLGLYWSKVNSGLPALTEIQSINGSLNVDIADGDTYVIYVADTTTNCAVSGPTDEPVDVTLGYSGTLTRNGIEYTAIGKVGGEGNPIGTYSVTCDASGAVIGPPIDLAGIAQAAIFLLLGVGSGVAGVLMVVIGLVFWPRKSPMRAQH